MKVLANECLQIEDFKHIATPEEVENLKEEGRLRRASRVSKWDPVCQKLIDHPGITPYLREFLGPTFRLAHDYCIFMKRGDDDKSILHGGPETANGCQFYKHHNGTIRNGLSVLTFFFADAGPGDGGFACVPGSHKSNFLSDFPHDVRTFKRSEPYVVQPVVKAGDALFFTEALVHGTLPWSADHENKGTTSVHATARTTARATVDNRTP